MLQNTIKKIKIHHVYFVVVLWLGIMFMAVLPPLSAPDEVLHFVGSYELSNKIMMKTPRDEDGNIIIRKEDEYIVNWPGDNDFTRATVLGQVLSRPVYEDLYGHGLGPATQEGESITLQQPVKTTPFAYLMPALGISIARLINLNYAGLLFLGRFMNLLLFTFMGALAVKRTPVGKKVFFAVSLFPMTLELAGSYSYDSFIMAMSFYLAAVILDHSLKTSQERIALRDVLEMAALAILLSPCKMIYSTLFLLCLMIPVGRWKKPSVLNWALSVGIIGVLIVGSIAAVNLREMLRYVNASGVTQAPEFTSSGAVNTVKLHDLQELINDKTLIFRIIRNTFQILGGEYLGTTVGMWLGAFDRGLSLNPMQVVVFWGAAICAALFGNKNEPQLKIWKRVLMAGTAVLLTFILLTSMLLSFTPAETFYILGVQGRYFLPYLPVLLIALRSGKIDEIAGRYKAAAALAGAALILEIMMDGVVLLSCFQTVMNRVG